MNTPPSGRSLLEARELRYSRNQDLIFGPLSFSVGEGEALLLRGDNGAGKTTLLRVLAGLLAADSGDVRIEGQPIDRDHLARHCAFLGHKPGHKAMLTCLDNLRYAAALHGHALSEANLEQALADVGLAGFEDNEPGRMSAGQNKRLALARLTVQRAAVWLLDEPYANLDLDGIQLVDRLIAAHVTNGGAVFLTTHGAYAAPPVPVRTLQLRRQVTA